MKRYIFRLLAAFTVIGFFATACSQIEEPVYEQTQNNRVSIRATINNTLATRVALTDDPDNKIVKAEWEEGDDFILPVNGKNYTFVYEAQSNEFVYDNKNGTFPSTFTSAGSVKASYPATTPADYSSQGGTLADVEELLTLEASIDVTANQSTTGLNLKFNHNSAIIKMALTNEAFKSKSVNVELYAEGLLSGSNIISAEGITADADGQATAYFAVPATGKEVKNCAIYATAGETTYKTTLGNNTITSGNLYNITKSSSNFEEIPAACYLPKGKTFRDAVVAAIGTKESVQVKFIANSRENLSGATEIGSGTGAYIKVNGSVIEIHTAAKEFMFNQDCSYMFGVSLSIETAVIDALARITAIDFNDCINTSNVTHMPSMFCHCSGLTSLNLSNFNTEKVTDMDGMFNRCSGLTSLNLSNFNTEKVTDMSGMFLNCENLKAIDLSSFNTSNVTDMVSMFYDCSSLTSLDLSNFNTESVTNMRGMFIGCSGLTSLNLSNFNTEKVTGMASMFNGCSGLTSLDLSKFNTANVTYMGSMFSGCKSLESLNLSNFNTANVTGMGSMFINCSNLQSLDLSKFNTENVTDMSCMFNFCEKIESLDLSDFNTANVTDMRLMFYNCSSLTSLDLGNFNTANVTDMHNMFYECEGLENLNISSFETSKVTDMHSMFWGCKSLESLNLSSFNTTNVTDMQYMFYACDKLKSLDLSKFNTAKVTNMCGMFGWCHLIQSIDLSNFNTASVTTMKDMFRYCFALESLDLTKFDVSKVEDFSNMFDSIGSRTAVATPIKVSVTQAAYEIFKVEDTNIDERYAVYSVE